MKKISIGIQEPYYSFVLNREKTVEGRLNKGKFASIEPGDILLLEPENQEFKVLEKNIYSSFKEMIESEGIENVIPDKETLEEATEVYHRFYTQEQEKEFGVCAIKIEKF